MLHVGYLYLSLNRKAFRLRHCCLLSLSDIFFFSMWEHYQHGDERRNKINDWMTNARLGAEEPELASCPARQGQGTTELGMAGPGMAGLPLKLTPGLRAGHPPAAGTALPLQGSAGNPG